MSFNRSEEVIMDSKDLHPLKTGNIVRNHAFLNPTDAYYPPPAPRHETPPIIGEYDSWVKSVFIFFYVIGFAFAIYCLLANLSNQRVVRKGIDPTTGREAWVEVKN